MATYDDVEAVAEGLANADPSIDMLVVVDSKLYRLERIVPVRFHDGTCGLAFHGGVACGAGIDDGVPVGGFARKGGGK